MVIAAMLVAMLSVIWTMGLLIGTGFSLHVMSSMIPVFLMPIAILDSIHILSEFFDQYPHHQDRRATLRAVYKELFHSHLLHHPYHRSGLRVIGSSADTAGSGVWSFRGDRGDLSPGS